MDELKKEHLLNGARWLVWTILLFICGCATLSPQDEIPKRSGQRLYSKSFTLGQDKEWRFYPIVADLNQDGIPDLIATHRNPHTENSLHIWLGQENGGFKEVPQTWSSPGYSALTSGDIDNDGHLDLVAASHFSKISTFLGDGKGGIREEKIIKTEDGYVSAKLTDLDRDGMLDAVFLGGEKAGIEIYRGNGTGNWILTTSLMKGKIIGRDLALTDLNHDENLDLLAGFERKGIFVYFGEGTGEWAGGPSVFYPGTKDFSSFAISDVNADGNLDIALNGGFRGAPDANGPDVFLGDGQGRWEASSNGLKVMKYAAGGVALGDLDNDGYLDLVASGNNTEEVGKEVHGLFLFKGDGQGNWRLLPDSGLPSMGLVRPEDIALSDLNRDGLLDIIVTHGDVGASGVKGYISIWLHH